MNTVVETIGGVEVDVPQSLTTRAITTSALQLEAGAQYVNGEEFIALIMAATEGVTLKDSSLARLYEQMRHSKSRSSYRSKIIGKPQ